jgi:hypothetical protein
VVNHARADLNEEGKRTAIMADYAMAGFMLTAVDQQLPPDRQALLPPRR